MSHIKSQLKVTFYCLLSNSINFVKKKNQVNKVILFNIVDFYSCVALLNGFPNSLSSFHTDAVDRSPSKEFSSDILTYVSKRQSTQSFGRVAVCKSSISTCFQGQAFTIH